MPRFPRTMSLMRPGGTSSARASWFWLISAGRRNSSRRISPGGIGSSFFFMALLRHWLMIIDDFNVKRVAFEPMETESPLIVDSNAMLALAISRQCFQAISGRETQVVKPLGAGE